MTNALSTFTFTTDRFSIMEQNHDIRVVTINGNPWFVAADVCRALDVYVYSGKVNATQVRKMLGADEVRLEGVDRIHPIAFDPRITSILLISESGLYKLIMRSDKPEAKPFKAWVCDVVLLAIRKDGAALYR